MQDEADYEFRRVGLAYRLIAEKAQVEIQARHLKRSSREGWIGEVEVRVNWENVPTIKGNILHKAQFNFSSTAARVTLGKFLAQRTPDHSERWDWQRAIEKLCVEVANAEEAGEPVVDVGQDEVRASQVRWAIDPIAPDEVTSLLYGPGGSGKSVFALACGLSINAGREIIPGLKPAKKGPVLYLDWETDRYVVNDRIVAIARGAGIKPPSISYRRCRRPLPHDAEELAEIISQRGIVHVIVDSAGMAMGSGSEYSDANEGTLKLFEAIRMLGPVSVHLIDHVSKQEMRTNGKVRGLMPYGSIYKVNLARSAWEIRNAAYNEEEQTYDDGVRISLIHTKANDTRLMAPMAFRIDYAPGSITFDEDDGVSIAPAIAMSVADRVAEHIEVGGPMDLPRLYDELPDVKQATIRKTLATATKNGARRFENRDGNWHNIRGSVDV